MEVCRVIISTMRISANRHDRGWRPDFWKYKAFLNDREVLHCITADEEKGFIDKELVGHNMIERTYGKVDIIQNVH